MLIVDLALPRNVAGDVSEIGGVELFDLDSLKVVVNEGQSRRQAEIPLAESIIHQEQGGFLAWFRERQVSPYIELLRQRAEAIRLSELNRALPKLGELDERQREILESLSVRLVNKLLHGHTLRFKHLAHQADEPDALLAKLFGFRSNGLSNPDLIHERAKDVSPLSLAKAQMWAAKEGVS